MHDSSQLPHGAPQRPEYQKQKATRLLPVEEQALDALDQEPAPQPAPRIEEPISLGSVALDVRRQLERPRSVLPGEREPWKVWRRVVGLYAIGMLLSMVVVAAAVSASGATNLIGEMIKGSPSTKGRLVLLLFAGVLAPLWEETAFRLPLAPFHPARILPSLALFGVLIGSGWPLWARALWIVPLVVAALLVLPAFFVPEWRERASRWWERHFRWVLAISIAAFGFAHAGNYRFAGGNSLLYAVIPLLVLPQLVAGVLLAYVRVKLGFWYGVALHATVNTSLMLPILLLPPNAKPKPTPKPLSSSRRQPPVAQRTPAPDLAGPNRVAR